MWLQLGQLKLGAGVDRKGWLAGERGGKANRIG